MLKRLTYWARRLKYGQFRLFLAFAQLTEGDPHHSVTIAVRDLCTLAGIATGVFPAAIQALQDRNLVTVRHGTNHRQNADQVDFFDAICVSIFDTPITENKALARAAAVSDFDSSTLIGTEACLWDVWKEGSSRLGYGRPENPVFAGWKRFRKEECGSQNQRLALWLILNEVRTS